MHTHIYIYIHLVLECGAVYGAGTALDERGGAHLVWSYRRVDVMYYYYACFCFCPTTCPELRLPSLQLAFPWALANFI